MNGPADLGGKHGFGPVIPEKNEPKFHAQWEREVMGLVLAMGASGLWPLDRARYMRETLPHVTYYSSTYYQIWFAALERLIAEADLDTAPPRVLRREDVRPAMARGSPYDRPGPAPAFSVGDRVRVHPMRPATHTRAPAYVRGRVGTIESVRGSHVFPDSNAHGEGENPVPLYTVLFTAEALWGPDTTADEVCADLFEPYLERVQ
ncbi:nitrile hydratase subunit beta [Acuticoccus sp. I52.16.1]|uniref:nitrile hydratase subunit beta n=1 Tax=Acuticoccus sp. I52.16.1 TaxID=2928472 RepID=UPI001FD1D10B|nr:nitrile hydratase subunit beta [Acuticoccus sp. I52.16.1]UOM36280.1 nitrile hydratase subunit beta [Acuticoccus sp. I52.16.1]